MVPNSLQFENFWHYRFLLQGLKKRPLDLPCKGSLDSVMEPVRVMTRRERHGITSSALCVFQFDLRLFLDICQNAFKKIKKNNDFIYLKC